MMTCQSSRRVGSEWIGGQFPGGPVALPAPPLSYPRAVRPQGDPPGASRPCGPNLASLGFSHLAMKRNRTSKETE